MLLKRTIPEIFSDMQSLNQNTLPYCTEVSAWIFLPIPGEDPEVWNVAGCNSQGWMDICRWEPNMLRQIIPVEYRSIENDTTTSYEVQYTILPRTDSEN